MADTWTQLDIFDAAAAVAARDAALATVAAATPGAWRMSALDAIYHLARTVPAFTTDDVWELLHAQAVPAPPEARALGAIMREACSLGVIASTDGYRQSCRPQCHARPVRVWRSCLGGGH